MEAILNGIRIATENTLQDAEKILKLISEGYPYSLESLGASNYYIVLVENPSYAPDNGEDPLLGMELFLEV
jgi:hypothetical protein